MAPSCHKPCKYRTCLYHSPEVIKGVPYISPFYLLFPLFGDCVRSLCTFLFFQSTGKTSDCLFYEFDAFKNQVSIYLFSFLLYKVNPT